MKLYAQASVVGADAMQLKREAIAIDLSFAERPFQIAGIKAQRLIRKLKAQREERYALEVVDKVLRQVGKVEIVLPLIIFFGSLADLLEQAIETDTIRELARERQSP